MRVNTAWPDQFAPGNAICCAENTSIHVCVSFCNLLMYRTYGQHALRELDYTSEATAITPSEGKKLLRQYHKRDANGSQQNNLAFVIGHLPSPREC